MKKKPVKVAIIDNSLNSLVYNPVSHWVSWLPVAWEAFEAKKSRFPDFRKKEFTHVILTGSEASIMERQKWVYEEVETVLEAEEKGLPILGSCYGHQLLALALAGSSSVQRCDQPEIGWEAIQILRDNPLLGEKREEWCFLLHFDEVVHLGDEFNVLASSNACSVQGFQWKKRPVWGLQAHPEIGIEEAQQLMRNLIRLNLPTSPLFQKALASLPRDSGLIRQIVSQFLSF